MTSIPSLNAAMWLPSAVSAQSQNSNNWISESLDPQGSLGLPHSEILQGFMDTAAAVGDTLAGASVNQAQGLAALAIQAANNRINEELGRKIAELTNTTSQTSLPAAPSTLHLVDGSLLDLAKNTFMLPDGTFLDITSGMKVIGAIIDVTA